VAERDHPAYGGRVREAAWGAVSVLVSFADVRVRSWTSGWTSRRWSATVASRREQSVTDLESVLV